MKIVEDSPSRLVLKESALKQYAIGALFAVIGVGVGIGGSQAPKDGIVLVLFGAVFAVAGIVAIIFSKSDTVTVDKSSRQIIIIFKSLKNKNGQSQTVSFDDVSNIQLFQQYKQQFVNNGMNNGGSGLSFGSGGVGSGNMQTELQMNLALQLKNGTMITIANEQRQAGLNLGISSNSLIDKGQKLAAAIGVPFQQQGTETVGQAFHEIKQAISGQPNTIAEQPVSANPPVQATVPVPPAPMPIAPQPMTPVNPAPQAIPPEQVPPPPPQAPLQ